MHRLIEQDAEVNCVITLKDGTKLQFNALLVSFSYEINPPDFPPDFIPYQDNADLWFRNCLREAMMELRVTGPINVDAPSNSISTLLNQILEQLEVIDDPNEHNHSLQRH